ncbi:MAG: hypothetical protein RIM84_10740 [Alphaproteobacteria bacterium]
MRLPLGLGGGRTPARASGAKEPAAATAITERDHYEILGDSGNGWNVLALVEQREAAITEAQSRFGEGRFVAVRVVKSSYDGETNEFREREALYLGERKRNLSGGPVDEDIGPVCTHVEHLLTAQARRTVRRLLGDWLGRHQIAAIELLHNPDHQQRLEGAGLLLQSAVQRAARAQAGAAGGDVQKRLRELFLITDELSMLIRRLWREGRVVTLEGDDVAGLAAALGDDPDRSVLFNAALSVELRALPNVAAKMRRLLDLLLVTEDPDAVRLLDGYVAAFLEEQPAIAEVLGDQPNLGAAVLHLFDLITGRPLPEASPPLERLREGVWLDELTRCRDVMARRLVASLRGSRPLVEGSIDREMALHRDLHERIEDAPPDVARLSEMREALAVRSERFVSPSGLNRLMERLGKPDARFRYLLRLAGGIFGKDNAERLGDAIIAEMNDERFDACLAHAGATPVERMRELRSLQSRVEEAGLSGAHAALVSARLDEMCLTQIRAAKLFERLEQKDGDPVEKAMSLLGLCGTNSFTRGAATTAAHKQIRDYLARPGALAALKAADADETARRRLRDLHKLLAGAGMDDALN